MMVEKSLYRKRRIQLHLCSSRIRKALRMMNGFSCHLNSRLQKETKVVELKAPMNMSSRK